jgi:hypothetical protein
MNYIDGFIDAFPPCFDEEKSQDAMAADHQIALDVLYRVGCQYSISPADMVMLCELSGIQWAELSKYSGVPA